MMDENQGHDRPGPQWSLYDDGVNVVGSVF